MKRDREKIIVWVLRLLVSGLFILSAFSKLLPANTAIFLFTKQIVDLGITNWCFAPLLARAIVAFELFLGLSLLQNHFLKKAIVPATFLLLLAFCIHLTLVIINTGNKGSCGCFGQLIPMTPLEAIIKNVVCMILLAYIYIKFKPKEKNLFRYPVIIFIAVYLGIFIFLQPKCCCASPTVSQPTVITTDSVKIDSVVLIHDTVATKVKEVKKDTATIKIEKKEPAKPVRTKVNSIFSKYTKFNTGIVDLNSGKKFVCLFSLECEHCEEANKILGELKAQTQDFPGVYILALGEESDVEGFFKEGKTRFPYTILPPQEFFPLLDKANTPPRVVLMDNGNFIDEFINFEHLDKAAVLAAIKK